VGNNNVPGRHYKHLSRQGIAKTYKHPTNQSEKKEKREKKERRKKEK